MSKLLTFLFLAFLSFALAKKNLNRKNRNRVKADYGEDCHFFNWCSGDLQCRDYRCLTKNESDVYVKLPKAPEGDVCDWFNHCPDGKYCEKHRCVYTEETLDRKSVV